MLILSSFFKRVPFDMELFIQFIIGSANPSFAILIMFCWYISAWTFATINFVSKFYDLSSTSWFKFKIKEVLIFILNHLDTRMITETRHSCENIRTVWGVIGLAEYSQIFCNVNKVMVSEGFKNIWIVF